MLVGRPAHGVKSTIGRREPGTRRRSVCPCRGVGSSCAILVTAHLPRSRWDGTPDRANWTALRRDLARLLSGHVPLGWGMPDGGRGSEPTDHTPGHEAGANSGQTQPTTTAGIL
jgi:hypothetical protein